MPKVALLFFGCTAFVAVIAWRTYGKVPIGIEPPFQPVFELIAFVWLVWVLPQFKCLGERIVIAIWAASQGIDLFARLIPLDIDPDGGAIGVANLFAWFVAVVVSASMLGSSIRSSRSENK